MSREIKFRAWDKENKIMIYDFSLRDGKPEFVRYPLYYQIEGKSFSDWIVMQYIGLKDKNGKEIYEGDIVKSDWYLDKQRLTNAQVVFEYAKFTCRGAGYDLFLYPELEIVGNIYENPELLSHAS